MAASLLAWTIIAFLDAPRRSARSEALADGPELDPPRLRAGSHRAGHRHQRRANVLRSRDSGQGLGSPALVETDHRTDLLAEQAAYCVAELVRSAHASGGNGGEKIAEHLVRARLGWKPKPQADCPIALRRTVLPYEGVVCAEWNAVVARTRVGSQRDDDPVVPSGEATQFP